VVICFFANTHWYILCLFGFGLGGGRGSMASKMEHAKFGRVKEGATDTSNHKGSSQNPAFPQ
jgi:hypothetical protein